MASVGTDTPSVKAPQAVTTATRVESVDGSLPGLYGGTRNVAVCDPARMVQFLQANPDKASAWAAALSIRTDDIATYVAGLTPVILRSDTAVTNHGFVNGRANEIPAILEAGTAVLVDKYGVPRVKCFCGNPLTPASYPSQPQYEGPRWPTFRPTSVIIVNVTTVVINQFTLVDPSTNVAFGRPAGTTGSEDGPAPQQPPTQTSTPTTSGPPGVLVDGTYTLASTPGTYAGCGTITGGTATLTVQGNNATINDPTSSMTYQGTIDRRGGTFHIPASVAGATFTVDGTIDTAGNISGTIAVNGGGESCQIPFTGHRG